MENRAYYNELMSLMLMSALSGKGTTLLKKTEYSGHFGEVAGKFVIKNDVDEDKELWPQHIFPEECKTGDWTFEIEVKVKQIDSKFIAYQKLLKLRMKELEKQPACPINMDININELLRREEELHPSTKEQMDEESEKLLGREPVIITQIEADKQAVFWTEFASLTGKNSMVSHQKLMNALCSHSGFFPDKIQAEIYFAKIEQAGEVYMVRPGYYKKTSLHGKTWLPKKA